MVDLSFLQQFSGGDKAKMAKYIGMFLKSYPGLLLAMDEKLAAGDLAGLKTAAHSLKPQLSYMGVKAMEELARQIEHSIADNNGLELLPEKVAQLRSGVEAAAVLLTEELAKLGN